MATLQEELVINGMRVRNRIALPPITTNYGSPEGRVTENNIQFYRKRSKDVGLVIVEATAVRADGRIVPNGLGLWQDGQIAGMARLAAAIKQLGAAAVVQLNHAGARCFPDSGELQGASPSGFAFKPDVPPFAMSPEQIQQVIADFADAAGRAVEAGFDAVEIHGAHLYLISQFLSPLTNRRTDRYGGDFEGRTAFAREIVRAVRSKVGRRFALLFRLNGVENVEDGQTPEDALAIARLLAGEGIDALDVSLVAHASWQKADGKRFLRASSALPKKQPAGANVALTARIREATGLPVIAVGKLGLGDTAAVAVRDFPIDLIAIGRQMIIDPDTAGKILAGRSNEIIPCEECMTCFATIGRAEAMSCKLTRESE